MDTIVLSPPIAFLINLALVALLSGIGGYASFRGKQSEAKSSMYSSGEAAPAGPGVPGYRPFFVVALFFAVLHLGVLVLGTSSPSPTSLAFLAGLIVALWALILG